VKEFCYCHQLVVHCFATQCILSNGLDIQLDLNIRKTYPQTKNEVSRSKLLKVRAQRQTDKQMRTSTLPRHTCGW